MFLRPGWRKPWANWFNFSFLQGLDRKPPSWSFNFPQVAPASRAWGEQNSFTTLWEFFLFHCKAVYFLFRVSCTPDGTSEQLFRLIINILTSSSIFMCSRNSVLFCEQEWADPPNFPMSYCLEYEVLKCWSSPTSYDRFLILWIFILSFIYLFFFQYLTEEDQAPDLRGSVRLPSDEAPNS